MTKVFFPFFLIVRTKTLFLFLIYVQNGIQICTEINNNKKKQKPDKYQQNKNKS